jgi:hypothetical protein
MYFGFEDYSVFKEDKELDPCLDIANHSPTGFNWGYEGSGPAQLALAIMVSEYGRDLDAHPISYHYFKSEVIAKIQEKNFSLSSKDVRKKVNQIANRGVYV